LFPTENIFFLANALDHSRGSSGMTAVRLVPLRHFFAVHGCFGCAQSMIAATEPAADHLATHFNA
jgi:hypothetical protein